jgi:hypothetical protein
MKIYKSLRHMEEESGVEVRVDSDEVDIILFVSNIKKRDNIVNSERKKSGGKGAL